MTTKREMMTAVQMALFMACLSWSQALGAEADPADDPASFLSKIQWVKGPTKAKIGDAAEIQVPAGYIFTGAQGAQKILEAFGNPTSGDELAFLAPTSMVWSVVFEFDDIGYVKDDEKDQLDAAKILKSIQAGNEQANAWRRKHGQAEVKVVGWEVPPRYSDQTHNLEWAIQGQSNGDPFLNYNVRLLGRKGVMSATLLVDPADMAATLPIYQGLLRDYTFTQGERYAEYRDGDKIAQYGLAALVVGGAAAGAAKLGLFAWLAVILKKAWKAVVVAVVAVSAMIKRLILGGRKEPQASA